MCACIHACTCVSTCVYMYMYVCCRNIVHMLMSPVHVYASHDAACACACDIMYGDLCRHMEDLKMARNSPSLSLSTETNVYWVRGC